MEGQGDMVRRGLGIKHNCIQIPEKAEESASRHSSALLLKNRAGRHAVLSVS